MKKLAVFLACVASLSFPALTHAEDAAPAPAAAESPAAPPAPDCAAKAADKKLAGAALNSFMKKCERDAAKTSCDATAAEKKLKGAAKTSFTKKCVDDAIAKPQ